MYDRKRYDTRMRDPEVERRKRIVGKRRPSEADPHLEREPRMPREARVRRRPEERFEAKRAEEPAPRRERPAPPPEPKPQPAGRSPWRRRPDLWWLLFVAWLGAVTWRFAAGAKGQGFLILGVGLLGVLFLLGGLASKEDEDWRSIQRRRRRRRLRLPRLLRQRQQPRTATVPTKTAPPKVAAPRPTVPRRLRKPRSKEAVTVAVLFGLFTSLGGIALKACKPDRTDRPRIPRVSVPRKPPPDLSDLFREREPASTWRRHLPPAARGRVSGGVLLGGRAVLPHVEVVQVEGEGRGRSVLTDEHGVFVFENVRPGPCAFQVRGVVDLGGSTATPTFGASGGRIEVDLPAWHAILLRRDRGASLYRDATVQVAQTNGDQRVQGRWKAGRTGAVLTGLRRDDYYDVLVQVPDAGVACLVERLPAGRDVQLELRRGVTVHGVVKLGAGASHAALEVILSHGGLQIVAGLYAGGGFQADHLPRGTWWDVQAFTDGPNGRIGSERQGVHAGEAGRIELDLR